MLKKVAFEIGKAVVIVAALEVGREVFMRAKHDFKMKQIEKELNEQSAKIVDKYGNVVDGHVDIENGIPVFKFNVKLD